MVLCMNFEFRVMAECQYATIEEVKLEAKLRSGPLLEAEADAAVQLAQKASDPQPEIPPPLPPPNKMPEGALAAGKTIAGELGALKVLLKHSRW